MFSPLENDKSQTQHPLNTNIICADKLLVCRENFWGLLSLFQLTLCLYCEVLGKHTACSLFFQIFQFIFFFCINFWLVHIYMHIYTVIKKVLQWKPLSLFSFKPSQWHASLIHFILWAAYAFPFAKKLSCTIWRVVQNCLLVSDLFEKGGGRASLCCTYTGKNSWEERSIVKFKQCCSVQDLFQFLRRERKYFIPWG